MNNPTNLNKFETWAIVELMGHVKIAGLVTEEERFGSKLGRCDVPAGTGFVTQYFNGSSVYRLTPCTEEIARSVASHNAVAPAQPWELPSLLPALSPANYNAYNAYNAPDFNDDDQ